jgi:hypothetical protein
MNDKFTAIVKDLKKRNTDTKQRYDNLTDQQALVKSMDAVQNAVIKSMGVLVDTLIQDTLKTKVINMPELSINATGDIVNATKLVEQAVKEKNLDITPLVAQIQAVVGALDKLPTEYPSFPEMPTEMAVNNLNVITGELQKLSAEVRKLKLDPKIDVKTPEIKLDISKEIKSLEKAIKAIKPAKATDNKSLEQSVKAVENAIKSIQFPVPNFRTEAIVDAIENISIEVDNVSVGNVGLKNIADAQINPATEEGLGDIVTAINNITVPAPVGGATETKQDDIITELKAIEANQLPDGHNVTIGNASIPVTGTFFQATQPISATALPLPTGASTSAKQDNQIDELEKIRGFDIPVYDAITVSYPNTTTEVFEYRTGGVSGTIHTEVTVIYTTTSKEFISSVELNNAP